MFRFPPLPAAKSHRLPLPQTLAAIIVAILLSFVCLVESSSFSYILAPRQKQCFFTPVQIPGTKLGFFFAVQSGGNFEISYDVRDKDGIEVVADTNKRNADFVFSAKKSGTYSFCFRNDHSSGDSRSIDVDITVQGEHLSKPKSPLSQTLGQAQSLGSKKDATLPILEEQLDELEEEAQRIAALLSSYSRSQRYLRTRENRSEATVRATANRVWYFSVLESVMIVAMAVLQVYVVRSFFSVKKSRTI